MKLPNIEYALNLVERIYSIFRPKTHNRITLAIVIAGTGILAGPYWDPYVRAIVQKYLEVTIDASPSPWFGLALIVIGVLYHLAALSLDAIASREARRAEAIHDSQIFQRFAQAIPEIELSNIIDWIASDHSYYSSYSYKLQEAENFLSLVENHFLIKELRDAGSALHQNLKHLNEFLSLKFFIYPPNQPGDDLRFCMQPEWNIDRGFPSQQESNMYDSLSGELAAMIRELRSSYTNFHRLAHEKALWAQAN